MKVVLLAGGLGTRISEETSSKPKPMVEVGGQPILWHIMKLFSAQGFNDFIVCLGYKGYIIKEYFGNYSLHTSDVTFDFTKNETIIHKASTEPWKVTLIDTGENTMTGGRIKRILPYIPSNEDFILTYGDGVADINLNDLLSLHKQEGRMATVTGVRPPGRFGMLEINHNQVTGFREKPADEGGWINGGFFVLSPKVGNYISSDDTIWEREPMEKLAHSGKLSVYHHKGFWQPMDTLRDKNHLEELWYKNQAPWKLWQ
jgi:glucose-1-phosphate cytidylyltransferase